LTQWKQKWSGAVANGARWSVLVLSSVLAAAFAFGPTTVAQAKTPLVQPAVASGTVDVVKVATAGGANGEPSAKTTKKPAQKTAAKKSAGTGAAAAAAKNSDAPNVYLFRGFMGVFSLGMDQLNAKLQQKGVKTKLLGHTGWSRAMEEILAEAKQPGRGKGKNRYPIVLVGHSLGANAALMLAYRLGEQGVPVNLVLTVDPTVSRPLTPTVRRYLNIFQENNGLGVALDGKGISPKRLENYNTWDHAKLTGAEVTHFSLDKNALVQQQMLDAIMKALGR